MKTETLVPGHPFYPVCFDELEKPPSELHVLGSLEALDPERCISIVGAREASPRALDWMDRNLPEYLDLRPDAIIVSGGARGIDQKAHAASVRKGRPTVVFLPAGLERIYPPDLVEWIEPVLRAGGAFVSPYPNDQEIRRAHFEGRNRLIAALGRMLFVVEARRKSGSLMTARLAGELGRAIAVLPSFPTDGNASGSLDLIIDAQAAVIRDAKDLAAVDGLEGLAPRTSKGPTRGDGKQSVRKPHRDPRSDGPFSRGAFASDVQDVVGDDEPERDHGSAGLHVPPVADGTDSGADGSKEDAREA